MKEQTKKTINKQRRAKRTRSNIHGVKNRPRLSVYISNKQVSAQIINDDQGTTLVSASSLKDKKSNLIDLAKNVGTDIAKKAQAKKIHKVVMDRGAKKYHGRIKALAEAARENGLEF